MNIRPILSTLLRHRTAAALIVLEIALSCAIVCNALFLIQTRLQRMDRPTGLANSELVEIEIAGIGSSEDPDVVSKRDLLALRAIPGVVAASKTNQIPFNNSSWNSSINLVPDQRNPSADAAVYMGDEHLLQTFGLKLVAGRNFTADEVQDWGALNKPGANPSFPSAILSAELAEKLFPGESALGKKIYSWGDDPTTVVGVVESLIRPNDNGGPAESQLSFILPVRGSGGPYVLRTKPEQRAEVMAAAGKALERVSARRILINNRTFDEVIADHYRQDRAMAWLLATVIAALLIVTGFGIVGLASFWVQQRTKQIGIRRALGATRGQILRYFQIENFLLSSIGIVLGMLLAYAINQLLMGKYELPRLPLVYLPVGAVTLWLLGQFAVFWPARRAAAVPPAVATRSA